MDLDLLRVTELWSPAGRRVGSGHLLGDRLVLTARHVVEAGPTAEVRRLDEHGATTWATAEVRWTGGAAVDAALLLVTDPAWQPPAAAPVRFGRVTGRTRTPCVALGFPKALERGTPTGVKRHTVPVRGHVDPLVALASPALLAVHVDRGPVMRGRIGTESGWSGASGAAVHCDGLLVSVLTTDVDASDRAELLDSVRVTALLGLPDFAAVLHEHGVPVEVADVHPATGLPPGTNNLPALPAHTVVGRADELAALAGGPDARGVGVVTQTVHGLGGVGKTTLVLQYAHTHLRRYHLAWWITADSTEAVLSGLAALARRAGLGGLGERSTTEAADHAVAWLQAHPGWLLVLDNAERPDDLAGLLGQLGRSGHILVTSRYKEGWPSRPLPLPVLDPADSLRLLTELTGLTDPAERTAAEGLAADLGHLPLALEQAGAYIRQTCTPVAEYRALLAEDPGDVYDSPAVGADPQRTIARIWSVTVDAVAAEDPLAVDVLHRIAWYAPDDIPRSLLADLGHRPTAVPRALALLATYGLVTLTADTVTTHRLVQAVTRTVIPDDPHRTPGAVTRARDAAAAALWQTLPESPSTNVAGWPAWRALLPHIEAHLDHVRPGDESTDTDLVLFETSVFASHQGLLDLAITCAERSVVASTRLHGPESPGTLSSRENLADAYESAGDTTRAIPLYEQSLRDRERILGPEHPHTLTSRNNLAGAYESAGELDRAIALYERNLRDRERILGPEHPHTLTSRNNLAYSYLKAGDTERAIPLFEQNLADREAVFGPHHPDTLAARNNLTGAYRMAGELHRAIPLYEQNLTDSELILGLHHPTTLTCRNNLAAAYAMAGNHDRAISLHQRNLDDREHLFGRHHRDTLISRNNLADAYRKAGDLGRAVPLYEQAYASAERFLGPEHPTTVTVRENLDSARAAARAATERPADPADPAGKIPREIPSPRVEDRPPASTQE